MRFVVRTVLAVSLGLLSAPAHAVYPERPITIVIPFAAGGGTDSVARVMAHELGQVLNGRVIVDNKPGANGAVAATYVARAQNDGYTLLMTTNTTHSVNPALMQSISYDPVRDFSPVAQMGNHPFMLIVRNGLPAKTLPEILAYARANPGKLSYGYGNGTGLVASETMKRLAGVDILKVPYRGTPQAMNDMLGERLDMMFVDVTAGLSHVQGGTLQAVAIANKEGASVLPQVKSVAQSGLPDFDLIAWNGVFAPAGTSREIIDLLNKHMREILERPGSAERFAKIGLDVKAGSPDDLAHLVKTELVKWAKLVADAGIEKE